MTKNILKDEILKDNQLEKVSGGTESETKKDLYFFAALGVDFDISTSYQGIINKSFAKYGVSWKYNVVINNYYKFGGDQKYPRAAALGYVLKQMNYSGYNGNWWDIPYTVDFIRNNICSNAV